MINKINSSTANPYSTKLQQKKAPSFEGTAYFVCKDIKKTPNFHRYCDFFCNHFKQYLEGVEKVKSGENFFIMKYPKKLNDFIENLLDEKSPDKIFDTKGMEIVFEREA